jgi:hypothetical protein
MLAMTICPIVIALLFVVICQQAMCRLMFAVVLQNALDPPGPLLAIAILHEGRPQFDPCVQVIGVPE